METTLKKAAEAFERWHTENKRRSHVEEPLRDLAVSLLEKHSPQEISKALGISRTSLRNWQRAKLSSKSPAFIDLPIAELNSSTHINANTLTVKLPYGIEIILPNQPTSETIQFIGTLVKEFEK